MGLVLSVSRWGSLECRDATLVFCTVDAQDMSME